MEKMQDGGINQSPLGHAPAHDFAVCALQTRCWPQVPGYESLMKGIAITAGIDEDTLWIWFENDCESLEQLQVFIVTQQTV